MSALFFYPWACTSFLTDLLSLRLVGTVRARNYPRSSILTVGALHDYDLLNLSILNQA